MGRLAALLSLTISCSIASPALSIELPKDGRVTAVSRADSGRYDIFRGMGRLIPGGADGFIGDAIRTAEGYYIGSVDEVYVREHICRVLVVGIAPEAQAAYGIHSDFIYVTLPWGASISDGTVRLPIGLREVARRF